MQEYKKIKAIFEKILIKLPKYKKDSSLKFFKIGKGEYAEHDKFIGISVPELRQIAKQFKNLSLKEIQLFLKSSINEERFLALVILVNQFKIADEQRQDNIFQFYLKNLKYVNNWNLVDASAHLIIGKYLLRDTKFFPAKTHMQEKQENLLKQHILYELSLSKNIWERRISIVATWSLIRENHYTWTLIIAEILLNDTHDLIHKAVGWMLREVGKRDEAALKNFLEKYAHQMPRTMLRYSIEKFPENIRRGYLIEKS